MKFFTKFFQFLKREKKIVVRSNIDFLLSEFEEAHLQAAMRELVGTQEWRIYEMLVEKKMVYLYERLQLNKDNETDEPLTAFGRGLRQGELSGLNIAREIPFALLEDAQIKENNQKDSQEEVEEGVVFD